MCLPDAPSTTDAAEIESEEAEAFAAAEVHDPTLLFIDFDLQSGQFLPEAFLNRRHQPVMPRVGIHQDHQIVSKTRILDAGVLAVACHLFCPLEHSVYLGEVEITEQWGDHSALRDAASTIGFQHDLQQVHYIIVIDSFRHFGQQSVVPNVVKIAPKIDIYDACLVLNDCLGHSVDRLMSCLLGSVGFRILISLHPAIQTTGRLTFAPAGLLPAEHTSLNWTHFRTAGFPRYGWKAGFPSGAFLDRRQL